MITVAMIIIVDRIDLTNMMYIACDLSVKCLCGLQHVKRFILQNVDNSSCIILHCSFYFIFVHGKIYACFVFVRRSHAREFTLGFPPAYACLYIKMHEK